MALRCALSNEVPEHPVVSPVSGSIFEKRLIEEFITENGSDPINGKELTLEMLIEVKTTSLFQLKPPSATSIPAILKSLQEEWDALMLQSFTQRQQYQATIQELSHALYQHDAACRVIGKISKEVSAAEEALATLKPQAGMVQPSAAIPQPALAVEAGGVAYQPTEQAGMSAEVIQKLQDEATVLTQKRKKRSRTIPEDLVTQETIRNFRTVASIPGLHSASVPGILSLDIHQSDTSKILTGGNDRNAIVFNKDTKQVVATLKGHTKKVTRVIYHPDEDIVLTASPDTTIRVWNVPASQPLQLLLRAHDGPVTGLSLHPTGDYVLSTSVDQHWAFSDIRSGRLLTKVSDGVNAAALTTAQFHPDGLLFGTGTSDSQVKIWDLKEQSNVANFSGHTGPITAISFSENGYYLATAADDSCIKLWDLRHIKNFITFQLDDGYEIKDLSFDQSGTYLAVAGTDIRVYDCKQWQELKRFNDHTSMATGVRFGKNAQFIASTSMDRTLKLYSV